MNQGKLQNLIDGLDLQTDLWWLATLLIGMLAAVLAAIAFPDGGIFWAYLSVFLRLAILIGLAQQPWGEVFTRLLSLGLVTGAFAIFGDYVLVQGEGRRLYPIGQARILESPVYIPIAWACSIVEFGYPMLRIHGLISKHLPAETAMGLTMATGGSLAALATMCVEFLAVRAGWWQYKGGYAILGDACALYVVMGTFFVFFSFLPLFARFVACPATLVYSAIRYGVIYGGVIFLSFISARFLVERHF
jgi:hypothetical protein